MVGKQCRDDGVKQIGLTLPTSHLALTYVSLPSMIIVSVVLLHVKGCTLSSVYDLPKHLFFFAIHNYI